MRKTKGLLTRIASVAVVFWWLLMCAALAWKERSPRGVIFRPVGDVWQEIDDRVEWTGLYLENEKIGYASTRLKRSAEGWTIEERAFLRLAFLGLPKEVKTTTAVYTDQDFALKGYELSVESGPTLFKSRAEVRDSSLVVEIESAGRVRTSRITLQERLWTLQGLKYALALQGNLSVGRRFRVPLLDPISLKLQDVELVVESKEKKKIGGSEVEVLAVSYSWGPLKLKAWVSPEGEILEEMGYGGLRSVKESQQQAQFQGWPHGKGVDLFRAMAVPSDKEIKDPRAASVLKVRFSGADLGGLALAGGRQKVSGNVVEITKEKLQEAVSYEIPYSGSNGARDFLSPSLLVQSDDPSINSTVKTILGGTRDALAAVELLLKWVHENLEKVPTLGVPSGVEVLSTKRGDCNEHATLYASLARAAGIPTKISMGLLYQEGKFYYHAWNEVFLGQWFTVDATLGQFPADATHIKVLEGDPGAELPLVALMGRLKAEILFVR